MVDSDGQQRFQTTRMDHMTVPSTAQGYDRPIGPASTIGELPRTAPKEMEPDNDKVQSTPDTSSIAVPPISASGPPAVSPSQFQTHVTATPVVEAPDGEEPAAKRPRLDVGVPPQTLKPSPSFPSLQLPTQAFAARNGSTGTVANAQNPNGKAAAAFRNSPLSTSRPPLPASGNAADAIVKMSGAPQSQRSHASTSSMGPPEKPESRTTDVNELGDVLHGAGVDLREEEAALFGSTSNQEGQRTAPAKALSSELAAYGGLARSIFSQDDLYSENVPGDRNSFYGAGTYNQAAISEESFEDRARRELRRTIRIQAEIKQYHLNHPFLQIGSLQRRVRKEVQASGLRQLGEDGIRRPTASQNKSAPLQLNINGPDKNEVLKIVRGEPLLSLQNDLVNILSLLSLATQERLRVLVEEAASLAKGRRTGAQGLIPDEYKDVAAHVAADVKTESASTIDMKAKAEQPPRTSGTIERAPDHPSLPNIRAPVLSVNRITETLQRLAKQEAAQEEARIAKRLRRATASLEETRNSPSLTEDSVAAATATLASSSDASEKPKKSALRTQKKMPSTPASEAQAFAASNKTSGMLLNNLGIKRKKLSWMQQDSSPSNPYAAAKAALKQTSANASKISPKKGGKSDGVQENEGETTKQGRMFGLFREDVEGIKPIQLRDLISALEHDGKTKKVLQIAYGRLGKKSKGRT